MCLLCAALAAAAGDARFAGDGSASPAPFEVTGPWTLHWTARTEFPALASIEIRLYDDITGEFLGKVADSRGAGTGHRLFSDPGRYRIAVVANSASWEVTIEEVSESRAEQIERQAEGRPSLLDSAQRAGSRVPEDSFETWSTDGDDVLLLFADRVLRWRISFSPPDCPGLDAATAISFVSAGAGSNPGYDSILLDDGTRCYFESAIPGY